MTEGWRIPDCGASLLGNHRELHFCPLLEQCCATKKIIQQHRHRNSPVDRLLCTGPCVLLSSTCTSLLQQRCTQIIEMFPVTLVLLPGCAVQFSKFFLLPDMFSVKQEQIVITTDSRPDSYLSSLVLSSKKSSNCSSQLTD